MPKCKTCSGKVKGWKCDICGAESDVHIEDHECGGEHCMPMCVGCGKQKQLVCASFWR